MKTTGKTSKKSWKLSYKRLPIDGRSKHPLYRCYASMKSRCHNKKDIQNYRLYGERGITVCDRWLGSKGFANFLTDMGEKPSPQHSLDRKDNDGNYEPSNCRWATKREQAYNKRNNLSFDNKKVYEIALETEKHPETIRNAIRAKRNPYIRPDVWNKNTWKHGTISGYSNHRCRCDLCRIARNKYRHIKGWS